MEIKELAYLVIPYGIFGVAFPLWAAKKAREKGLKTVSRLAIVSIFVLLGHLGGLVALIASAGSKNQSTVQRKYRQKSWVDNLVANFTLMIAGAIVGAIGYLMWVAIQNGTHGAVIIGFIPIPIEILPLLALGAGGFMLIFGLIKFFMTLFRRFVKGSRAYRK